MSFCHYKFVDRKPSSNTLTPHAQSADERVPCFYEDFELAVTISLSFHHNRFQGVAVPLDCTESVCGLSSS